MAFNKTQPSFEMIKPNFGSSFYLKQYTSETPNINPQIWHFHPELELVYIKGGSGKRHIGHHLSYFRNGDLILMGKNLPHFGFTIPSTGNHTETIIQFREDFLGTSFFDIAEMTEVKQLFTRAGSGLIFHGQTKLEWGARIENLATLAPDQRLLELLSILKGLAISDEYKLLNAKGFTLEIATQDNERINDVYQYVRKHFQRHISLDEISSKINMNVSAFCRYFKKLSGKTFTQFVNEFRVVHACKLLSEQPLSISAISLESGFNNFSHFNKQFKLITGRSPSEYRNETSQLVNDFKS